MTRTHFTRRLTPQQRQERERVRRENNRSRTAQWRQRQRDNRAPDMHDMATALLYEFLLLAPVDPALHPLTTKWLARLEKNFDRKECSAKAKSLRRRVLALNDG